MGHFDQPMLQDVLASRETQVCQSMEAALAKFQGTS